MKKIVLTFACIIFSGCHSYSPKKQGVDMATNTTSDWCIRLLAVDSTDSLFLSNHPAFVHFDEANIWYYIVPIDSALNSDYDRVWLDVVHKKISTPSVQIIYEEPHRCNTPYRKTFIGVLEPYFYCEDCD